MNIPEIDWRYHDDKQLAAMVEKIEGFLALPPDPDDVNDKLNRSNCHMLIGMVREEQAERWIRRWLEDMKILGGLADLGVK
jgi:hypothetical protein